jgi:NADPH:quinone reductase-like Zn-dependent oxidoreductase
MRAIVQDEYGQPDVLRLTDVAKPEVGDDDVLVRVHAAGVNPADWHMVTGTPYLVRMVAGVRTPKTQIPGADLAGRVEAVGSSITEFSVGDDVFGENAAAYAEYATVPQDRIAHKPSNATFEQAAAMPIAAITALQGLRDKGQVSEGQTVLINGASGGVGTFAVQIAKSMGAVVTGVSSTRNTELVSSIGADHVIDYTEEDFTTGKGRYDVILDTVGNHALSDLRSSLTAEGRYVSVGKKPMGDWIGPITHLVRLGMSSALRPQSMRTMLAKQTAEDLATLVNFVESGAVTPVIDTEFTLDQVPDALTYLGEGHTQGNVVISIKGE